MLSSSEKVLPGGRLIGAALRLIEATDVVVDWEEADSRTSQSDGGRSGVRELGEKLMSAELICS
jgi:hypothetical protein